MSNNKPKQPSRKQDADAIANSIPDPWLIPNQANKTQERKTIPKAWQLATEPNPLISPAGSLGVPSLASHQLTSEEILLEEELKLALAGSLLKQLEQALALIYWLKDTKRSNWQMSS